MKTNLYKYTSDIDRALLTKNYIKIKDYSKDILIKISFYQHERLIHLLVTSLVAILLIISLLFNITLCNIGILVFDVMLFLLLIPYIIHYYYLENGVQLLYKKYDELKKYKRKISIF